MTMSKMPVCVQENPSTGLILLEKKASSMIEGDSKEEEKN